MPETRVFSLVGNGNPLQCSCLENPRDWGAWWAAISGVTQSQTWLKQLSSSSSSDYITSSWRLAGGTLSAHFWCLCQKLSLSPLYFNKTLLHKSSEWSSFVSGPGLISSPPEAKNPGVFSFSNNLSSWRLIQDPSGKVRMLGALVLCSPSEHIFCCALLTLRCACVNEWNALSEASAEPCSAVQRWSHMAYCRNLSGVYTDLPMPKGSQHLLWGPTRNGQSVWAKLSFLCQTFWSLWPFHNSLGIRSINLIYQIIDFQGTCDLCY